MRAFAKLQNHYHQYWYCCPKPKTKKCFYSFWWQGTLWANNKICAQLNSPHFHPLYTISAIFILGSGRQVNYFRIANTTQQRFFQMKKYICFGFSNIFLFDQISIKFGKQGNQFCTARRMTTANIAILNWTKSYPPLSPPKEAKWLSQDRLSTHSRRRES